MKGDRQTIAFIELVERLIETHYSIGLALIGQVEKKHPIYIQIRNTNASHVSVKICINLFQFRKT